MLLLNRIVYCVAYCTFLFCIAQGSLQKRLPLLDVDAVDTETSYRGGISYPGDNDLQASTFERFGMLEHLKGDHSEDAEESSSSHKHHHNHHGHHHGNHHGGRHHHHVGERSHRALPASYKENNIVVDPAVRWAFLGTKYDQDVLHRTGKEFGSKSQRGILYPEHLMPTSKPVVTLNEIEDVTEPNATQNEIGTSTEADPSRTINLQNNIDAVSNTMNQQGGDTASNNSAVQIADSIFAVVAAGVIIGYC